MPGNRIAKGAKAVLPKTAQRMFRHVVQSEEKKGLSPKRANMAAWSAVHSAYKPGKTGKWVKKT
jgi:cation transport regulator ChaB